jgi:transposase
MRWHGRRVAVHAYGVPTDMRKGFDGLCAVVSQRLGRDPLNGDVYLFVSRDRIRAKVLHFDGTGLCVYAKRLERGRFASLWRAPREAPITLTVSELDLFLDGRARGADAAGAHQFFACLRSPPMIQCRRSGEAR